MDANTVQSGVMVNMDAIVSLAILLLVTGAGASKHADLPAGPAVKSPKTMAPMVYWQAVLPETPMPQAIHDLLTQSTGHVSQDNKGLAQGENSRKVTASYGSQGEEDTRKVTTSHKSQGEDSRKVTASYGSQDDGDSMKIMMSYGSQCKDNSRKATTSYGSQGDEESRKVTTSYGSKGEEDSRKLTTSYGSQGDELSRKTTTSYGSQGDELSRKTTTSYGSQGDELSRKTTTSYGSQGDELSRKATTSYGSQGDELSRKTTTSYGSQGDELSRKTTTSYGSQGDELSRKTTTSYGSQGDELSRKATTSYGSQGDELSRKATTSYGSQGDELSRKTTTSYGSQGDELSRKTTTSYGSQGEKDSRKATTSYRSQGDRHDHIHSHNNGNKLADVFFFHDVLRPGSIITPTIPPTTSLPPLLPRHEAETIPFSTKRFGDILTMFAPASHAMADEIRWTLDTCEHPQTLAGEKASCATSFESLAKLPAALLGIRNVHAFSGDMPIDPAGTTARRGRYNVTAVRKLSDSPMVAACHDLTYPYAVYYCHTTNPAAAYLVTLAAEDGGAPAMEALAVCHLDTSQWTPRHPFLVAHNLKPGDAVVCHFLSKLSIVWVPAGEQGGAREARKNAKYLRAFA
ncbi:polygalacturonase 1 beta-like protein 3 isoform X2 [Setaria italica]|uniref:polygalacturonase 1 beta-like protein 3 isoform X2 n=1 Tax=Setaria italica TaxID=4555 RepID=UPI000BE515BD|nr:polygalacturonase 1 beta-like protein 3 isoform X2 [Setaria italica]